MRESNQLNLDEAEWSWLKPHLKRDALILVAQNLDLVEVGDAVAKDATQTVQEWINQKLLGKPSAEQIKAWDQIPSKRFMSLVIAPYVLIQELTWH